MVTFRVRTSVGRFFEFLKNGQFRFFKCSTLKRTAGSSSVKKFRIKELVVAVKP
jgi:hypothetical protein